AVSFPAGRTARQRMAPDCVKTEVIPLQNGAERRGEDDAALFARNTSPPAHCDCCLPTSICLFRIGTGNERPRCRSSPSPRHAAARGGCLCISRLRPKDRLLAINQLIGLYFPCNPGAPDIPAPDRGTGNREEACPTCCRRLLCGFKPVERARPEARVDRNWRSNWTCLI